MWLLGPGPLWIVTGLYLIQAWAFWSRGERGMGIAFVGYAAANCGLLWHWYSAATPQGAMQ